MTDLRLRGRFYCRCEGKHSQRHLEESKAGRESRRQNMVSRLNQAVRGDGGRAGEEKREDQESTWPKWQGHSDRNQSCGWWRWGTKSLGWRGLG